MHRTTVSLPDDIQLALEREAKRRRTSVSAVVRTLIVDRLGIGVGDRREIPFAGIVSDDRPGSSAREMQDAVGGDISDSVARGLADRGR